MNSRIHGSKLVLSRANRGESAASRLLGNRYSSCGRSRNMALAMMSKTPAQFSDEAEVDRVLKIINDHPFPHVPLLPVLQRVIQPHHLSNASFVEAVIGRLFSGHANGLKALELFMFSLSQRPHLTPSRNSVEMTLQILARMGEFDRSWDLIREIQGKEPSLITRKCMAIVLSRYAKFKSFEETLAAFERLERLLTDREFGIGEFNVLLRAFCTQRQMEVARAVFIRYHSRFSPNLQTMNILLSGFKESGNLTALELFYHDMVRRGFNPDLISYNIRIDAYCKKGCFSDALRLKEEMEAGNLLPTVETMTTLIHGAGIARNPSCARRLFDEMPSRKLQVDVETYNALICSFIRARDLKHAIELMNEMEAKGIDPDNTTYHTVFVGLRKLDGVGGFCRLYRRMIERNFVPKMITVVMLMRFFCENSRVDLGLALWRYMMDKGCCPHGHALDLLATALCCSGRLEEAYECFKQVVERGRHPCVVGFRVLEGHLERAGKTEKLQSLTRMMKRLYAVFPPPKAQSISLPE